MMWVMQKECKNAKTVRMLVCAVLSMQLIAAGFANGTYASEEETKANSMYPDVIAHSLPARTFCKPGMIFADDYRIFVVDEEHQGYRVFLHRMILCMRPMEQTRDNCTPQVTPPHSAVSLTSPIQ